MDIIFRFSIIESVPDINSRSHKRDYRVQRVRFPHRKNHYVGSTVGVKQVVPVPAPDSEPFVLTPKQLEVLIIAERVQLRKLSVKFDIGHINKVIIGGVAGPKPVIEFKKDDIIKLNGEQCTIFMVESNQLWIIREGVPTLVSLSELYLHITEGKVQYKDNQEQWHQVDPIYEPIKAAEMALAWRNYYKTNPKKGYPKQHEIRHCMLFYLHIAS